MAGGGVSCSGFPWPLPLEQPGREETAHGKRKRAILDGLFAFHEEIVAGNLLRVEPEFGGENWQTRKQRCITLVFGLGSCADRLERHLSATLNGANGSGQ